MHAAAGPAPPEIPNYRLIKRIGRGAFGEVWLAEETLTRIYRAVKIVPGAGSARQRVELDGVRQYQQRSRGHAHLVQVLTVGEQDDALYYVMEAADNALGSRMASPEDYEPATLVSLLAREGQLPIETALDYTTAMLEGVEHLHRSGLAHRDLKPSNVLFVDGAVKLADVGLASSDAAGSVGTPGYRTPEGAPDDLYAVGVMLYEMITGQAASSFPELPADLDRTHEPRKLRRVLRLIDQACHPNGEDRFKSVGQFSKQVALASRTRRVRSMWIVSAIAAVSLAGALAVVLWVNAGQSKLPEWTDLEFVPDPARSQWTAFPQLGDPMESRFRLDGSRQALDEARLVLSGEFFVGYAGGPESIMSLYLTVENRIVHVIYWDVPGEEGKHRVMEDRIFHLRNDLLDLFADEQAQPVYVLLGATDDFFRQCDEYKNRLQQESNRILIGHIRRKPSLQ